MSGYGNMDRYILNLDLAEGVSPRLHSNSDHGIPKKTTGARSKMEVQSIVAAPGSRAIDACTTLPFAFTRSKAERKAGLPACKVEKEPIMIILDFARVTATLRRR